MTREWREKLKQALRELYNRALAEPVPEHMITTLAHLDEPMRK